jgi:hypothetical protein
MCLAEKEPRGGGPVRLGCHAEGKGACPRPAGGTDPGAVATSGRPLRPLKQGRKERDRRVGSATVPVGLNQLEFNSNDSN